MEIVIDIDKEVYDSVLNDESLHVLSLPKAFKNCIVLPENHGKLMDANKFIQNMFDKAEDKDSFITWENAEVTEYSLRHFADTLVPSTLEN